MKAVFFARITQHCSAGVQIEFELFHFALDEFIISSLPIMTIPLRCSQIFSFIQIVIILCFSKVSNHSLPEEVWKNFKFYFLFQPAVYFSSRPNPSQSPRRKHSIKGSPPHKNEYVVRPLPPRLVVLHSFSSPCSVWGWIYLLGTRGIVKI